MGEKDSFHSDTTYQTMRSSATLPHIHQQFQLWSIIHHEVHEENEVGIGLINVNHDNIFG